MTTEIESIEIGQIEQRLLMTSDPRRKLDLVREALPGLARTNPSYAASIASEGYGLSIRLRDIVASASLLYHRGIAWLELGRRTPALEDLQESYAILAELGEHGLIGHCALTIGLAFTASGETPKALEWYRTALENSDDCACDVRAAAHEGLGTLRTSIGDYPRALEHLQASLALREELMDHDDTGRVLRAIGALHAYMGDPRNALEALHRSILHGRMTENRMGEVEALTQIAEIDLAQGDLDGAMGNALRALTIYEALGHSAKAAGTLALMSAIHERMEQPGDAIAMAMRAYAALGDDVDDPLRVRILLSMGRLYAMISEYDRALHVFDQALGLACEIKEPRLQAELHAAVSKTLDRLGRTRQALEHHRRFAELREDLAGIEKQRTVALLQVRFDLERRERERETYRLRAEGLEAQLRLKQNELTAMALRLVQKKELLESLERRLDALQRSNGVPCTCAATDLNGGMGNDSLERMIGEMQCARRTDSDWQIFEGQLETLHGDFLRHLSDRWPSLTPTELKICSLARLGLSTKEIANVLYTSARTVHTHRYNIRRKLGLVPTANLGTFLANIP